MGVLPVLWKEVWVRSVCVSNTKAELKVHLECCGTMTDIPATLSFSIGSLPVEVRAIRFEQCTPAVRFIEERTCEIIEDGYAGLPSVCSECGMVYDDGRYCKHCGAKVVKIYGHDD